MPLYQAAKLQFGALNSVTSFYGRMIILHVDQPPCLVITFIAEPDVNVGAMEAIAFQLRSALEPISAAVATHISEPAN